MLVSVSYVKDKWVVDEDTANIYPEFRAVLSDATLGVPAMAYIALGCDSASDNPLGDCFETNDERLDESARCVFREDDKIPSNPKVHSAVNKYSKIVDTAYSRGVSSLNGAIDKIGKFLQESGEKLTEENIAVYMSAAEKLPKVLLGIKALKDDHNEATTDKKESRVKGDKKLGWATRKYLQEN